MKKVFRLVHQEARDRASAYCQSAPEGYVVTFSEPTRTLEQNAAQWPILEAFAKQLQWPVNGEMVWLEPKEFKEVLTAAFKEETVRLAAGLRGGVVMLGVRTSKFKKDEFSEWLEFLHAVAADRGVNLAH